LLARGTRRARIEAGAHRRHHRSSPRPHRAPPRRRRLWFWPLRILRVQSSRVLSPGFCVFEPNMEVISSKYMGKTQKTTKSWLKTQKLAFFRAKCVKPNCGSTQDETCRDPPHDMGGPWSEESPQRVEANGSRRRGKKM
jgi:hypothetical protein